ncbi:YolD-like family protein [Cytobacillus dafuensis]|uniref:YolD-like family protein n=1 Tax=Cytobacillus dafuensis TaxID=1742359 RepID=A0A5B8Z3H0_CYTDA|nr:YolD-like family protein [Cytobacillus dafuensis]QED47652.1 YolD-like family protein [Cytobacillus dafuensis]
MGIRDRGIKKFIPAYFMPEQMKMIHDIYKEDEMQTKPIVDEYEIEELENRIYQAIVLALIVKVKVWSEGFFHDYAGRVCRLDALKKMIYLENEDGYIERIQIEDVVRVEVEE